MKRAEYASLMVARLESEKDRLSAAFLASPGVRSFILDDFLPEPQAREVFEAFPAPETMMKRHSLRESKYFAAQLDRYSPLLEEIIYAFQDPRILRLFADITGAPELLPDAQLYAGGISTMVKGSFLNPHLDNSHDAQQRYYRAFNSLFYVTPDWREEYGGNLELWDAGPTGAHRTVLSKFNRLVMMETNRSSWHSVSPVLHPGRRTCVSNYFFRATSPEAKDYFHATSFRGRPDQGPRDLLLRADNALRTAILSAVNVPTKHIYKKR
jgi:Rps23 Pro-64 3,4-dihydroxylase Tpa1-like proline 4-hydroxylase